MKLGRRASTYAWQRRIVREYTTFRKPCSCADMADIYVPGTLVRIFLVRSARVRNDIKVRLNPWLIGDTIHTHKRLVLASFKSGLFTYEP